MENDIFEQRFRGLSPQIHCYVRPWPGEAPDHFNKNWKKGAKFYKADTRFAIEVERGY